MKNHKNSPKVSLEKERSKDSDFKLQKKVSFEAFRPTPKTMRMVSKETGILRTNITWFITEWLELGVIFKVKEDVCPLSKTRRKAWFYTSNPDFRPKKSQLDISFDNNSDG